MARTKEDAITTSDLPPRRRGRPAKASTDGAVKKAYVPTGRPRGRPKSGNPPQPAKVYVPTGRPRGRPPGSGKKKKAPAKAAKATTDSAPASASKPKATGVPGKRGRPRKSDVAAAPSPVADTPKPKGKRGRPPKKSLEPKPDADDFEDLVGTDVAEPLSDVADGESA
ncbi:AT hook-like protein [Ophiocordyceps sinensis CO18]|uniref:AT hook-like protein n=1 Tax=Ophiocordyceps sinensis (strain Co18 / CGMCC 3.14243) TaxID=911162 RepID=T5AH83_OPHSC|nr:AT hook-like protein [Ophiocordyceps sinensis CO18]